MTRLEQFARRLREEPGFSRNRRYDELSHPEARHLRRRLRRLEGVARELREAEVATLHSDGDGYRLVMSSSAVRVRREAWLNADEYALLRADGHLARVCSSDPLDRERPGNHSDAA